MAQGDEVPSGAGKIVSDVVFMKAQAMSRNELAEVDYEIEVTMPDGVTIKDKGTLRKELFQVPERG